VLPLGGQAITVVSKGLCGRFENSLCDTSAEGDFLFRGVPTAVFVGHWHKATQLLGRTTRLAVRCNQIAKPCRVHLMGKHKDIATGKTKGYASAIDRDIASEAVEVGVRAFPGCPECGCCESAAEQQCRSRQKPLHQYPQKAKAPQPRWFCTAYSKKSSGRRGFSHTPALMVKQHTNWA
jgi:hypothetical protein